MDVKHMNFVANARNSAPKILLLGIIGAATQKQLLLTKAKLISSAGSSRSMSTVAKHQPVYNKNYSEKALVFVDEPFPISSKMKDISDIFTSIKEDPSLELGRLNLNVSSYQKRNGF